MDQLICVVEDVTSFGEDVAGPLEGEILRHRAELVIETARRECSKVCIDVQVVESDGRREDWFAHIVVERAMDPALLEELFPDLNEVTAMGKGRLLLSTKALHSINDARGERRE